MASFLLLFLAALAPISLGQAETNKAIYRIDRGFVPNEYLLIENREKVGLENDMPNGGLAIWHIDEATGNNDTEGYPGQSGWPGNGKHFKVALLQADGNYGLEKTSGNNSPRGDGGDVYPSGTVNAIGMSTTPSTDRYNTTIGTIGPTANRILNISAAGATMTFDYQDPRASSTWTRTTPALQRNDRPALPHRARCLRRRRGWRYYCDSRR